MLGSMRNKNWQLPIVVVCQLLVLQPVVAEPAQRNLRIVVVEGEGNKNVVQQIAPRPIIVRVVGGENLPIAGATVVFNTPAVGPGGEFGNDSRSLRIETDQDGLASAGAFHPNSLSGSYQIRVTAEFQGETAIAAINQANIAGQKGHGKWIAIGAIVAGAAGAAIAFRNKDSGNTSAPTITFGGSAVGAPK
jgi:hypothetical protein